MEYRALGIAGPVEILPSKLEDERGYFSEIFRADAFGSHVSPVDFVQENQSLSVRPGTIRGIHFQAPPTAQGKLVRCLAGSIFDVAVDLRHDSASFGSWIGVTLSPRLGNQLWVPSGFGHAFCVLEPMSVVCYKVTAYYSHDHDTGIAWDDPSIGIRWPKIADPTTLSPKDRGLMRLAELPSYFSTKD